MATPSKKLQFCLTTAKNMFDFIQQTEMSYDYGTDFSNFIDNDIKEVFEDFVHFENDIFHSKENMFSENGSCIATITIYANSEETLNSVGDLISKFIKLL